jgi:predicted Zn-dependent protease with MMP-like domain
VTARRVESWDDLTPKQAAKAQEWLRPFLVDGEQVEAMFRCDSWWPLMSIVLLTNVRIVAVPDDFEGDPRWQAARAAITAIRGERRRLRCHLVVERGDHALRLAGVSPHIVARLARLLEHEPIGRGGSQIDPGELAIRPDERANVEALTSPGGAGFVAALLGLLWIIPAPLFVQIPVSAIGGLFLLVTAADLWRLLRWHFGVAMSSADAEFEALVDDVESTGVLDPRVPDDFDRLVQQALDELPDVLRTMLNDNVAVIVADDGAEREAYGLYDGDGIAFDTTQDRIIIFRDTLVESFGGDPDRLREQVRITVLHELAHHLGADELRVRDLGLE